jgi:hypothetical protein
MKMNKRCGPISHPGFYREHIKNLTISGGEFVFDNRHQTTHYHNNSKTFNTQNETTVFNSPVNGYIRNAKSMGPVTAYRQDTTLNAAHHQGLEPDAAVPRLTKRTLSHPPGENTSPSLRTSISNIAFFNLDHDRRDQYNLLGNATTRNRLTPSHNRDLAGGKRKEHGRLMLTGQAISVSAFLKIDIFG